MSDLKIQNLNKKYNKYLFKNKFNLRRKPKRQLLNESFFMFICSFALLSLNYLIPNKKSLFQNIFVYFDKSFSIIIDLFFYLYQIFLVVFILISLIFSIILLIGSFYRIVKVFNRKSKQITFK